jgi:hypothetical protein
VIKLRSFSSNILAFGRQDLFGHLIAIRIVQNARVDRHRHTTFAGLSVFLPRRAQDYQSPPSSGIYTSYAGLFLISPEASQSAAVKNTKMVMIQRMSAIIRLDMR